MAETWHGYMAMEDINLNAAQRQALWDEMQQHLATAVEDGQPAEWPQPRLNLDQSKLIIEARFRESALTVDRFKQRLGVIFGVDPAEIDHSTSQITLDTLPTQLVMFSYNSVNYVRFAAFGGIGSTWLESLNEAQAYISQNAAEWEQVP